MHNDQIYIARDGKSGMHVLVRILAVDDIGGDYASIVFDNELSDIPQGNITYRWFKCAGLGSGAGLVAKELGSSPSLSLSGLQGSYINCEVTLTVNGKSKTFVPKAICNGKVSDGIYVRPRIG